jgi:hypothetical protein
MKYIGVTIHPYSYQMGQMFVDPQIHSLSCLHSFFNTLAHCVSLHNKDVVARRRAVGMILDALRASPPGAYKTNRHNACRRYFGVTDSYSLIIGKLVSHIGGPRFHSQVGKRGERGLSGVGGLFYTGFGVCRPR